MQGKERPCLQCTLLSTDDAECDATFFDKVLEPAQQLPRVENPGRDRPALVADSLHPQRHVSSTPTGSLRPIIGVPAFTLPWSCHCRATARSERQPPRSPPFTPKESRPCSLQKLLRVPAPLALPYTATQACRTPSTVMQVSPRLLPAIPAGASCETRPSRRPKVRPAAMEQHRPRDKCHG